MNPDDIREIVRIQLQDADIEVSAEQLNQAVDYYNQYGRIPDINYMIATIIQNQVHNENSAQNPLNIIINTLIRDTEQRTNDAEATILIRDYSNRNNLIRDNSNRNNSTRDDDTDSESDRDEPVRASNNVDSYLEMISDHLQKMVVKKVIANIDDVPLSIIHEHTGDCTVCYDPFVETDLVRTLPCKHQAHRRCIDDYLLKESYLCPLCKQPAGEYKFINL